MSALRQALRRSSRLQDLWCSRSLLSVHSGPPGALPAAFQQTKPITSSSASCASVHIEDELYCRQRQLLVLGNRVPVLAPDSWVAPNAVIIGDVDIFDQVRYWFTLPVLNPEAWDGTSNVSTVTLHHDALLVLPLFFQCINCLLLQLIPTPSFLFLPFPTCTQYSKQRVA